MVYDLYTKHSNLEADIIQSICEVEKTQKLGVLQLAQIGPMSAGYFLTGNRSSFVHIEGPIAWLYTCQQELSPFHQTDQCFDKIPIHHEKYLKFIDPISRQTDDFAKEIECGASPQNMIQLDPDLDKTWYQLLPRPTKCQSRKNSVLLNT